MELIVVQLAVAFAQCKSERVKLALYFAIVFGLHKRVAVWKRLIVRVANDERVAEPDEQPYSDEQQVGIVVPVGLGIRLCIADRFAVMDVIVVALSLSLAFCDQQHVGLCVTVHIDVSVDEPVMVGEHVPLGVNVSILIGFNFR